MPMPRWFHRLFEGLFVVMLASWGYLLFGERGAILIVAFILGATRADVYHKEK